MHMSALDYNYIANLVVNAQLGDSNAFAELYAATYQKEYHFAYCYLRDEHLAQDALQETYILALKNISKLKDPMLVVAWLNQINFRVCYQLQKKQKVYDAEMVDYDSIDMESTRSVVRPGTNTSSAGNNPEDQVVRIDSQEYIMNQILKLPFTEAQVIILKFYRNLKHSEIAELVDISQSSVKRYLNSGKAHLEKIFQQQGGDIYL